MKNLIKVQNELAKKFLGNKNINGLDIGYKIKKGKIIKDICIRFFVEKKLSKNLLKKSELIPTKFRKIKTDIIEDSFKEFERVYNCNSKTDLKKYDILKGGIQIRTILGNTGTLGLIVKDNTTNKPVLLTNRHVIDGSSIGDLVYHPKATEENKIAVISKIAPKTSFDNTTYLDAAIAEILPGVKISNGIEGLGTITGINSIDSGEFEKYSVAKRGRTTLLTHGFTAGMSGIQKVTGKNEVYFSSNNISILPDSEHHGKFSYVGDSGSAIIDDKNNIMALMYAGSETTGTTIAIPIEKIFEELDLSLLTDAEIEAWNTNQENSLLELNASNGNGDFNQFKNFVDQLNLRYFTASELWIKGHQNANPNSKAYKLNTFPPSHLWPNIIDAIKTVDELRFRLNSPIKITSAYRTNEYNQTIGGAENSTHTKFSALDFTVFNGSTPQNWAASLNQLRDEGFFTGGIGIYFNYLHVDGRGYNADWSNLYT